VTLDETFIGAESFGGYIWRDMPTGDILIQLGAPSYRIMKLNNLETCEKVQVKLDIAEKDIRASADVVAKRQQSEVREPDNLRIARTRNFPTAPAPVMQALSAPLIQGAPDVRVVEKGNPAQWFRFAMVHNDKDLAVQFQVADPSPWMNAAGSFTHAFTGGDAVDLQLDVPGRGPVRILGANVSGKPTVVYWQLNSETEENPTTYVVGNNLRSAVKFPVVKTLTNATLKVEKGFTSYTCLLTVPLEDIGLKIGKDVPKDLTGIVGVIYSNPAGDNRAARLYWHNKKTGMVSDVPSEARLTPQEWGPIALDP